MGKKAGFKHHQETQYRLAGQFLGFWQKQDGEIKGLRLQTPLGEQGLKIGKKLRSQLLTVLTPGSWVETICDRRIDFTTGHVILKVDSIESISIAWPTQKNGSEPIVETVPANTVDINTDRDLQVVGMGTVTPLVQAAPPCKKAKILMCQKSDCMKRQGKAVCQALEAALHDRQLTEFVQVKGTGCLKHCKAGPNLVVDKVRYSKVTPEEVPDLLDKHFVAQLAAS
ncbi:(2Fe-2S) ferredoxin domain-containing protein [Alkalinema pantanalense CENA528]|uniref:(2Fe-2S) ferredoxin domain-containing protein n=1 Tax=Alkalinema pantanalense TaxID=1620705 RepID=UPI003D6E7537